MAKATPAPAAPAVDINLFDARVVDRHIAEGRTTQEAYEAFLASMPDESEEAAPAEVRFVVRGRVLATRGIEEDEN